MNNIIECNDVSFSYDLKNSKNNILSNVYFNIPNGALIALLGPNGSGKSTFLNCLCGLLKPQSGNIFLDGENIQELSRQQISKKIAYVHQKISFPFDYLVKDYIAMGRTPYMSMIQRPGKYDYEIVENSLSKLGATDLINKSVGTLSGGEQQLVSIARAIVQQPKLIILDEPTSALDFSNQLVVIQLIKELSLLGFSVLFTTHNPDQCLLLQASVAMLDKHGKMVTGNCHTIITDDTLSDLYGVKIKNVYSKELKRMICMPNFFDYKLSN